MTTEYWVSRITHAFAGKEAEVRRLTPNEREAPQELLSRLNLKADWTARQAAFRSAEEIQQKLEVALKKAAAKDGIDIMAPRETPEGILREYVDEMDAGARRA